VTYQLLFVILKLPGGHQHPAPDGAAAFSGKPLGCRNPCLRLLRHFCAGFASPVERFCEQASFSPGAPQKP